jgi:hypothetical protein
MGDDRALAEIFADDVVWHVSDEFRGQAGLWGWHEDTKAAEGAEGAFDEHVQVPLAVSLDGYVAGVLDDSGAISSHKPPLKRSDGRWVHDP